MRVVLDADLAALYGVPTKRLNEAVRRNADRFPRDFCFQLTQEEALNLKSQFATSSLDSAANQRDIGNWSQPATSSDGEHGGRRNRPWAFTEHGALMAGNVLRSPRAVQMSLYVVRAFVRMREELLAHAAILKRLAQIDRKLLEHDVVLRDVVEKLMPLLAPPPEPPKRKIGFHAGNR
jgi:ORF6N domain